MVSERAKVVVVTGASAGVGRATAVEFAKAGCDVALLARGVDGLEAGRREVEALGRRAVALPVDVADHGEMKEAARQIEQRLGEIDVWVNNAMVSVFSPFHEMKPEEFRRVTEVTYLGTVYGTMAALGLMLPRDRGCSSPRHPHPTDPSKPLECGSLLPLFRHVARARRKSGGKPPHSKAFGIIVARRMPFQSECGRRATPRSRVEIFRLRSG